MNAKDIAYGYAIGFNDGVAAGGGKSDEWIFPDIWKTIPDPAANQIIIYNEALMGAVAPIIGLYEYGGTIDYGDGNIFEYPVNQYYDVFHLYKPSANDYGIGQFILTITANGKTVNLDAEVSNCAFMNNQFSENFNVDYSYGNGKPDKCSCIRAMKIGSGIKAVIGDALSYSFIRQY